MDLKKLSEPQLSDNALTVLKKRYFIKDDKGNPIEGTKELFARVANNIAQAEKNYGASQGEIDRTAEEFYNLMTSLDFLPNSPTLMNAGRDLQQLAACFVLPIKDSIDGIFDAIKSAAIIHKSGGGTGFSFSRLRPNRDKVKTTNGVSSGPVSFMKVFNAATEAVKQGGTRRGANMGILRVDHPDIREFITCKADDKEINNFNISVAITEKFMEAVKHGRKYDLINPRNGEVIAQEDAREIFDMIVEYSWKNGDPGIVFIDRINKDNPTPNVGEMESTNPCGEQPLLPFEACNLGSVNLANMLDGKKVDFNKLAKTVRLAVHFLDNVIDMSKYPLDEIDKMVRGNRKIGLGVMGWADMLLEMGISYKSEEAVKLAEKVMKFVHEEAEKESEELGKKRGLFPNYKGSAVEAKGKKLRNATLTTIAPTGTLSMIASCSSGVEPLFAVAFIKTVMDNDKLPEINRSFLKAARERGFYSDKLMMKIGEEGHITDDMKEVPEDIKKTFVTAHDIEPVWHIKMQAAFQKHTDNAVSKTVNFKNSAGKEDVREVYMLAYELDCKGVTIYRDGSRDVQVLTVSTKDTAGAKVKIADPDSILKHADIEPRKRPDITFGRTIKMKTGCGNLYVTVNEDEEGICELFTTMGKSGGCASAQAEAISRLVSVALRAHVKPDVIVKHLRGTRCPAPAWQEGGIVLSCPDAIGIAMEKYIHEKSENKEKFVFKNTMEKTMGETCPECGTTMEHEGGCNVCRVCGYSKCL
ncbi:MAG TPA: vitamin B12-dependent ribonucleotide reductase [Candidatus Goldiibacteriota bacterium]|nr:vitamin B12-dependent ribonucleotide reductase [Candidatus Goldiibacteriota bacterium]HRQ44665.1 vitamin B12-dependent ribonucleotide reductase [Candidatus Goldiibacteriota bacterium]